MASDQENREEARELTGLPEPEPRPDLPIDEAIKVVNELAERAYASVGAWPEGGYETRERKSREAYAALGHALATAAAAFKRAAVMF